MSTSLGERLRRGIEDNILTGLLAPSDRLDERALAIRHKVSRTPVREALLHLSALGLVSMRSRQPACITSIPLSSLIELMEMMCFVEAQTARLAARRMNTAQRDQLQIHTDAAEVVARHDMAGFIEANWKLHLAIFAGSQNTFLCAQARNLRLRLRAYRCYLVRLTDRMAIAHAEHETVVRAIRDGDGDVASNTMRHHLTWDAERLFDLVALMPQLGGGEETDEEVLGEIEEPSSSAAA